MCPLCPTTWDRWQLIGVLFGAISIPKTVWQVVDEWEIDPDGRVITFQAVSLVFFHHPLLNLEDAMQPTFELVYHVLFLPPI